MTSADRLIEFEGFIPSNEESSQLKSVLERIYMEAPSDAYTRVLFTKNQQNDFSGTIKVQGTQVAFSAVATGLSLVELAETLVKDVRSQLINWKQLRFNPMPEFVD